MLNKSISHDKAVADLVNELGGYAGMVFTWMIAHLDREGRIHGDPEVIKGLVFPRIAGVTPELIRSTAARATQLGLIVWYERDGERYIAYPKFDDNQSGLRKEREAESEYPAPTCEGCRIVAGVTPEDCRSNSGATPLEVEVEVESKEKGSRRERSVGLATDRADGGGQADQVRQVFAHYRKHHPRAHTNPKSDSKEWKSVKARLAEGIAVERLCLAIDGMHQTPHNLGENERGQQYLGLELCMRNASQVERFAETAERVAQGQPPRRPRLSAQAEAVRQTFVDLYGEEYFDGKPDEAPAGVVHGGAVVDAALLPKSSAG
jgi:hypothetical protein